MEKFESLSPDALREVERVCDRFEQDLRAGCARPITEYLTGVAKPARSALARELEALFATAAYRFAEESLRLPTAAHTQTESLLGQMVGPYRIESQLGAGGMGLVYRATDTRLAGRIVAVKMLPAGQATPDAVARFSREGTAALQLHHDQIVRCFEWSEDAGRHYLVMEWVDGMTLADYIARKHQLTVAETARIGQAVARALGHAMRHGIVHRDIKPANILLTRDGRIKLADLGLARYFGPGAATGQLTMTHAGMLLGTIDYMAPEQAEDATRADIRSDIYSLGCTLYHCLAGRPPFGGSVVSRLKAHQDQPPPPLRALNPDVPPLFAELIEKKLLAKKPQHRIPTPGELEAALKIWTKKELPAWTMLPEALPLGAPASPAAVPAQAKLGPIRPRGRTAYLRRAAWIGLPLVVAASIVVLIIGFRRVSSSDDASPPNTSAAAEVKAAATVTPWESIFNGKDLTGWTWAGDPGAWKVGAAALGDVPAELRVTPGGSDLAIVGNGPDLLTLREYGDCVVELECMLAACANSGVFLMGEYEIQLLGPPAENIDPKRGMGSIYGQTAPSMNAGREAGKWQSLRIEFRAPRFQAGVKVANARFDKVVMNGEVIHENVEVPGPTSARLLGRERRWGPLMLQAHGGGVAFRNIKILELPGSVKADDGWLPLFDGQVLEGWTIQSPRPESWRVDAQEKSIVCRADDRTAEYFWTQRALGDFDLRLEFRMTEETNSGVAIRGEPGKYFNLNEIQIRDDATPPQRHRTGSLIYTISDSVEPQAPALLKKYGEWNSMRILAAGPLVLVAVNDAFIGRYDTSKIDPQAVPNEKLRTMAADNLKRRSGAIGLLMQRGEIHFRNIRVRELP